MGGEVSKCWQIDGNFIVTYIVTQSSTNIPTAVGQTKKYKKHKNKQQNIYINKSMSNELTSKTIDKSNGLFIYFHFWFWFIDFLGAGENGAKVIVQLRHHQTTGKQSKCINENKI
jgi:hypothetical protein